MKQDWTSGIYERWNALLSPMSLVKTLTLMVTLFGTTKQETCNTIKIHGSDAMMRHHPQIFGHTYQLQTNVTNLNRKVWSRTGVPQGEPGFHLYFGLGNIRKWCVGTVVGVNSCYITVDESDVSDPVSLMGWQYYNQTEKKWIEDYSIYLECQTFYCPYYTSLPGNTSVLLRMPSLVVLQCFRGFETPDGATIQQVYCTDNKWVGQVKSCDRIGTLPTTPPPSMGCRVRYPENGHIIASTSTELVTLCNVGYHVPDSEDRYQWLTCAEGEWDAEIKDCEASEETVDRIVVENTPTPEATPTCPQVETPENARVIYRTAHKAVILCNKGFKLKDDKSSEIYQILKCYHGEWYIDDSLDTNSQIIRGCEEDKIVYTTVTEVTKPPVNVSQGIAVTTRSGANTGQGDPNMLIMVVAPIMAVIIVCLVIAVIILIIRDRRIRAKRKPGTSNNKSHMKSDAAIPMMYTYDDTETRRRSQIDGKKEFSTFKKSPDKGDDTNHENNHTSNKDSYQALSKTDMGQETQYEDLQ